VRLLKLILKFSRLMQLLKVEGIGPVRMFCERSSSEIEGMVEISSGMVPVR